MFAGAYAVQVVYGDGYGDYAACGGRAGIIGAGTLIRRRVEQVFVYRIFGFRLIRHIAYGKVDIGQQVSYIFVRRGKACPVRQSVDTLYRQLVIDVTAVYRRQHGDFGVVVGKAQRGHGSNGNVEQTGNFRF